jgi:hypothetical protein
MKPQEHKIQEEIEAKIIDWITMNVSGRLVVTKSDKNSFGADLIVNKKGDYKGEGLFLKVQSQIGPDGAQKISKDFLIEEFKIVKNLYLLFVYFDTVRQRVLDYVWIIPSSEFKDIADVTTSIEGKKIFRFEVPLDIQQKNKYSGFLVYTKDLGKVAFDIINTGKPFVSRGVIFKEEKGVNKEELLEFLKEARLNTFASNNAPVDNPRLLGSKEFSFQKGELFYRDIFFNGNKKFIGQEVVYIGQTPVFGMSYLGSQIEKLQEAFLKESLFRLAQKCRLWQNSEFERREYRYENFGQGDVNEFFGQEKISVSSKPVYKLEYRGGFISDKI